MAFLGILCLLPVCAQTPVDGFNPNVQGGPIVCINVQPDGKILLGGSFTHVGGVAVSGLARLYPDGSLDQTIALTLGLPLSEPSIRSVLLQADGRIVIAGNFAAINGRPRTALARINQDGTLDDSFNVMIDATSVDAVAQQRNGMILVAGRFASVNGRPRTGFCRLTVDGELDEVFDPASEFVPGWTSVTCIAVEPNQRILIGGQFKWRDNLAASFCRLNPDGRLDLGFKPPAHAQPYTIAIQADQSIVYGGQIPRIDGVSSSQLGFGRLKHNGSADNTFRAAIWNSVIGEFVQVGTLLVQPDGGIIIGGMFNRVNDQLREGFARFNTNGALDNSFTNGVNSWGAVFAAVLQPDNKILMAGAFSQLAGQQRNNLGRLHLDGSLDTTFNPIVKGPIDLLGLFSIGTVALQTDEKILIGGNFVTMGGQSWPGLGRLFPDGRLDTSFRPLTKGLVSAMTILNTERILVAGYFSHADNNATYRVTRFLQNGAYDQTFDVAANDFPMCLVEQPNQKIVVGGRFTSLRGTSRGHLARFNYDGSLDATFTGETDGSVETMALEVNGKLLLGGDFHNVGGVSKEYLARLNQDGTLDRSFQATLDGFVATILVQPDAKLLVGGSFTVVNGEPHTNLVRFLPDGRIDQTFECGADGLVRAFALHEDGRIDVGGDFFFLGGQRRDALGRLQPNGRLDTTFDMGPIESSVFALSIQADGKLIVAGSFTELGGQSRDRIGRISSSMLGREQVQLSPEHQFQWHRNGTGPSLESVRFLEDYFLFEFGSPTRQGFDWYADTPVFSELYTYGVRGIGRIASGGKGGGFIQTRTAVHYVRPPIIKGWTNLGGGVFQIAGTNLYASPYTVFATTNLSLPSPDWSLVGTTEEGPTHPALRLQFRDPDASAHPSRFYQLGWP